MSRKLHHRSPAFIPVKPHVRIVNLPNKMALRMRMTNSRILEALKLLLAVSVGFSIRTLTDMSFGRLDCQECPECPANAPQDILTNHDLQIQLREPFKPKTIYDVIRYDYFTSSVIMNNFDEDPKIGLLGHQKNDIKDVIHQAMTLFNAGRARIWILTKLLNGYRRFDPLRGEEFILDVEISQPETKDVRGIARTDQYRFSLVKPFTGVQMVDSQQITNSKMIHFILPVSGHVIERFEMFMKNFEEVCLKSGEHVYLLVVLFAGKSGISRSRAKAVKNNIEFIQQKHRRSHIRVIQTNREFSRSLGLDLGAKQLPPESLMFFCDTDVTFTQDFLQRCNLNSIQGKQVYYPIVFGQYNPEVIKGFSPKERTQNLTDINKHTGHWITYGFGMACMYNIDYRSVGGLNVGHAGWGGEDVDLYTKHVRSSRTVFRTMEHGLIHRYHNKACDPKLPGPQYKMCVDSSAETYGSRAQLAKKLTALEKLEKQKSSTAQPPTPKSHR